MRGVTFNTKHSYEDWHLFLRDYPKISPPAVQKKLIEVPGKDGVIDLTQALDGFIHYNSRKITLAFRYVGQRAAWPALYSEIAGYLHGEKVKIILDDDSNYYYLGMVELSDPTYKKDAVDFVMTATVDPYKYDLTAADEAWLWDPFSFIDGVIRSYTNIDIPGTKQLTVMGSQRPVRPEFTVTGSDMQLVVDDGFRSFLPIGRTTLYDLVIGEGTHTFVFTCINGGTDGNVTISYRGGSL